MRQTMPSLILGTFKVTPNYHLNGFRSLLIEQFEHKHGNQSLFSDVQMANSIFLCLSSSINPSRSVFSRNVTIWLTRSTFKIKAVIRIQGQSYRNWDYLRFGCVAMVTLTDRCSLRCNLGVLFYTRVLSAF